MNVTWEKVSYGFWAAVLPNGWTATVSQTLDLQAFTAGASGPNYQARGDRVRRTFEDAKARALWFAV